MYHVPQFKVANPQELSRFMRQNSFATLVGCGADGFPAATHVPVLIDEKDGEVYITGHIMKQTDHHKTFLHNSNALVIFNGPHAYISASWYPQPQQASTWNYMTVHAKGELTFLDDNALLNVLQRTTAHFENNASSAALVEKMPPDYVQRLMKAIVAFKIKVTQLDHVFKLSQNKDETTFNSIIAQLGTQSNGVNDLAIQMQNHYPKNTKK